LVSFDDPKDSLRFQFNPTTIRDVKDVQWAEANVPGGDDNLATFGSGSSQVISLSLFFNAFGQYHTLDDPDSPSVNPDYVDEKLNFLMRFAATKSNSKVSQNSLRAPGLLIFVAGKGSFSPATEPFRSAAVTAGILCRLNSVNIERTMFDPKTYKTIRATAAISLTRYTKHPR
jgi:hypothetical protein